MEREDFMEMEKENFGIFIFIVSRPFWGAEFIIKES